jgi:isoleucyl-tRNA synthetase
MRGYLCERKAGWDTHGLPVEVEVCKELGIHAKEEIEAYGVEPFIHKCQSVWRYMKEWERLTERIGFWVTSKRPTSPITRATSKASGGRSRTCSTAACLYQGPQDRLVVGAGRHALSAAKSGRAIARWPIRVCM